MKFFYQDKKNYDLHFHIAHSLTFGAHMHESVEIIYLEEGTAHAFAGGKDCNLSAGDFFVVFPNSVHYYDNCQDNLAVVTIVPLKLLSEFHNILTSKTLASPRICGVDKRAAQLLKMLSEYDGKYRDEAYHGLLLTAFSMIMDKADLVGKKAVDETTIGTILAFCEKNYKEKISLKILSENLNISQSHISHIFADRIHMNFRDYINSLRLNSAVKLLREAEKNITDIAFDCGFDSIRTFNRAFKKKFGVSPKEYVK
ncbi:MAG: AraC family transcriptional regulator [Clostridia bacterium]|nr:AraC family transcriptional regulator [Clostridia bacterium]